ncbi:putative ATP-binding cassette sub-family F member 3 [Blattamonas nauphoetae]|uniref:ATP-binding cassette sub-family F member 3 n=1 Tax=Blattamonas nauphoetae TaxID=2049346 RepID=A0ABQ9YD48_9EUKA|nr:putative ATP-binding cassette sub-family F member 3 [Blattamonas nauphoetae]
MEDFTNAIIRPPRIDYGVNDLGPAIGYINEKPVTRTDFEVSNDRNLTLKCSVFYPTEYEITSGRLPCVVYCHANAGCRLECFTILSPLLKADICVVAFDFAGCGVSDGSYISLGFNEIHDLTAVMEYITKQYKFKQIVLWGRSMGASTALIYASTHRNICGMILDSPFSRLSTVVDDIAREVNVPCGCCFIPIGKKRMQQTVLKLTGMNVNTYAPVEKARSCTAPLLLAHGRTDHLISISQSQDLFTRYGGTDKKFMVLEGDHNDIRDDQFLTACLAFIRRVTSSDPTQTSQSHNDNPDLSAPSAEMEEVSPQTQINASSAPRHGFTGGQSSDEYHRL